jgi:deazaflavin-dependent oxidoreductase (nitroreductase family)
VPGTPPDVRKALATDGSVDITTRGARTGLSRRVEIWFVHVGGRTFLTGTPGPRGWYANLLAHDRLTVHLKESVRADLAARAVPVRDEATRRWLFSQSHRWVAWYRSQAPLEDLVARSPMVELHFHEIDGS